MVHEKACSVWKDPLGPVSSSVVEKPGVRLWPEPTRLPAVPFSCACGFTPFSPKLWRRSFVTVANAEPTETDVTKMQAAHRAGRARCAIRRRQMPTASPHAISRSQPADGSGTSELPKPGVIAPYSTIPALTPVLVVNWKSRSCAADVERLPQGDIGAERQRRLAREIPLDELVGITAVAATAGGAEVRPPSRVARRAIDVGFPPHDVVGAVDLTVVVIVTGNDAAAGRYFPAIASAIALGESGNRRAGRDWIPTRRIEARSRHCQCDRSSCAMASVLLFCICAWPVAGSTRKVKVTTVPSGARFNV